MIDRGVLDSLKIGQVFYARCGRGSGRARKGRIYRVVVTNSLLAEIHLRKTNETIATYRTWQLWSWTMTGTIEQEDFDA